MAGDSRVAALALVLVIALRVSPLGRSRTSTNTNTLFLAPSVTAVPQVTTRNPEFVATKGYEEDGGLMSVHAAFAAAVLLCGALRNRPIRRSSVIARRNTWGLLDMATQAPERPPMKKLKKAYWHGMYGYSAKSQPYTVVDMQKARKMALGRVYDPIATFAELEFDDAAPAKFDPASRKVTLPEGLLTIQRFEDIPRGNLMSGYVALEKDRRPKARPTPDEEYKEFIDNKTDLIAEAEKLAGDQDFIADRECLTLLQSWVNTKLKPHLVKKGFAEKPIDLFKVTKKKGSKTLVLSVTYDEAQMVQLFWPDGKVGKSRPNRRDGSFLPAMRRAATDNFGEGDLKHMQEMTPSKMWHVKGGDRYHCPEPLTQMTEFELGGLKMAARGVVDGLCDGKSVELMMAKYQLREDITFYDMYNKLMFGGPEVLSLSFESRGKIVRSMELTVDQIRKEQPKIVEAAEKRYGKVVALLKKLQGAMAKVGDDEAYVLQYFSGELLLGPFTAEREQDEEDESDDEEEGEKKEEKPEGMVSVLMG